MKKIYLALFLVFHFTINAQLPSIQWQQLYGGSGIVDMSNYHMQTADGGFIMIGNSSTNSNGGADFWIVKFNSQGNTIWEKKYGGSADDNAFKIKATSDGGYIVVGSAYSNDGDIIGHHGVSNSDAWILKLNASGNIEWQKTLGGIAGDEARDVIQLPNGEYIVIVNSNSTDGDFVGNYGFEDAWVIKLSASGTVQWKENFGGSKPDLVYRIESDGNDFVIGGRTNSNNGDVSHNFGATDVWIIKVSSTGNLIWEKSYGGTGFDVCYSMAKTLDGGYILAGEAQTMNGAVTSPIAGETDVWVIKVDSSGDIEWQKTFGGSLTDNFPYIIQTPDLGYIFSSRTQSNTGDIIGHHGSMDAWVVKIDATGEVQWETCFGGSNYDLINCISVLPNEDYLLSGVTNSSDGDIASTPNSSDAWVIKFGSGNLSTEGFISNTQVSLYPNPCTDILNLDIDSSISVEDIIVFDMSGKIIAQQSGKSDLINTSSFQKGVYFISLVSNTALYKLKFIKN